MELCAAGLPSLYGPGGTSLAPLAQTAENSDKNSKDTIADAVVAAVARVPNKTEDGNGADAGNGDGAAKAKASGRSRRAKSQGESKKTRQRRSAKADRGSGGDDHACASATEAGP